MSVLEEKHSEENIITHVYRDKQSLCKTHLSVQVEQFCVCLRHHRVAPSSAAKQVCFLQKRQQSTLPLATCFEVTQHALAIWLFLCICPVYGTLSFLEDKSERSGVGGGMGSYVEPKN